MKPVGLRHCVEWWHQLMWGALQRQIHSAPSPVLATSSNFTPSLWQKLRVTRPASCLLSSSLSTMLQFLEPLLSLSSFSALVLLDSDQQSCLRSALTLIFKLLAPMIFERCGSSADAELVRGSWSNKEPLLLSARIFFFSWRNGALTFFFRPLFCLS